MMQSRTKRITTLGFLLAVSILLGYVEHLIPFFFGVPGAKLGLANLIVVLLLFRKQFKIRELVLFSFMRILLSSLLFANMFSFLYSLTGAAFSLTAMILVRRCFEFDAVLTSMIGGVFHNVGQIIVATLLISKYSVLYYLPMLLVFGLLAGFAMGVLSNLLIKRGIL